MKNKVYTVNARRWGDCESHNYIVGVYSKKYAAQKVADEHELYRGGKYSCEILEWTLDAVSGDSFTGMGFKLVPNL